VDALSSAIEVGVGFACLLGAAGTWRPGPRTLAVLLGIAGVVAVAHGILALAG
jgi:hypothetical protein